MKSQGAPLLLCIFLLAAPALVFAQQDAPAETPKKQGTPVADPSETENREKSSEKTQDPAPTSADKKSPASENPEGEQNNSPKTDPAPQDQNTDQDDTKSKATPLDKGSKTPGPDSETESGDEPRESAGQDDKSAATQKPAQKPNQTLSREDILRRSQALATLYELLERDREDIARLENEKKLVSPETAKKLSEEIREEEKRISSHQDRINSIATGVDLSLFRDDPGKALDWQKEAIQFVKPFITMVKSATKKPREIEKYRAELDHYRELKPVVESAIANIDALREGVNDPTLDARLNKLRSEWVERRQEVVHSIDVSKSFLEDLTRDKRSFIESSSEILKLFFRSRGRNLLYSILSFVLIFLVMRVFHRKVIQALPIYQRSDRPFYIRLLDVTYHITTVAFALAGTMIMMYISGDWLLLSVIILLMLGVFWAARQALPLYWTQIRTLLNIGSIRENERIIYQGLPYRVVRLNLDTILENPDLDNCRIRLPLRDVVGFYSRPVGENEPWFPCRSNDWVMLSDSAYGQVLHQTQDLVQMRLPGGSLRTYQTMDFLDLSPTNLSSGFRISSVFGVDYSLQGKIAEEVPNNFADFIRSQMDRAGYAQFMLMLAVEFQSANSSSLDLLITVDMAGKAAPHYFNIKRALQRFAVMAATEYDYGIPYPHMVLQTSIENPVQVNLPRPATPAGRGTTARRPSSGLSENRADIMGSGGYRAVPQQLQQPPNQTPNQPPQYPPGPPRRPDV